MASKKRYYQLSPGKKHTKTLVPRLTLLLLGHALQTAYYVDPEVNNEVNNWPETFSFVLNIEPHGPRLTLIKRNGKLEYLGEKEMFNADVVLALKNIEYGWRMMLGLMSVPRLVYENRQYVQGDLAMIASVIRCMNIAITMMLPIANRLYLKEAPRLSKQTIKNRIAFYTLGWLGLIK
ncbi:MAG: hypothetical protein ACOCZ2_01450 [Thermodesulfobacteriota bacterium]